MTHEPDDGLVPNLRGVGAEAREAFRVPQTGNGKSALNSSCCLIGHYRECRDVRNFQQERGRGGRVIDESCAIHLGARTREIKLEMAPFESGRDPLGIEGAFRLLGVAQDHWKTQRFALLFIPVVRFQL